MVRKRLFNVGAFQECLALSGWREDLRSRVLLLLIGLLVRMSSERRITIQKILRKGLSFYEENGLLKFTVIAPEYVEVKNSNLSLVLPHQDNGSYQSLDECFGTMYPKPECEIKYIIDAGAHIGFFSIANVCRLASCEEVIAIEPDPDNIELLKHNVSQIPGVRVVPGALSTSEYPVQFERANSNTGHIAGSPGHSDTGDTIHVESLSLLELLPATWNEEQTWIKLDIEGAEYGVFDDLLSSDFRPAAISAELHDYFGNSGKDIVQRLRDEGYSVTVEGSGERGNVCRQITATKR